MSDNSAFKIVQPRSRGNTEESLETTAGHIDRNLRNLALDEVQGVEVGRRGRLPSIGGTIKQLWAMLNSSSSTSKTGVEEQRR
jgi:hypothetical protein